MKMFLFFQINRTSFNICIEFLCCSWRSIPLIHCSLVEFAKVPDSDIKLCLKLNLNTYANVTSTVISSFVQSAFISQKNHVWI